MWKVEEKQEGVEEKTDPDIELSRPNPFWNPHSINDSSCDVENGHEQQPAERCIVNSRVETVSDDVMWGWHEATQTKSYENPCKKNDVIYKLLHGRWVQ